MTTKLTEKNISSVSNAGIQWQPVKTSGFTAVAGQGYFCNTTSSAFTVTLPATATAGDTILIKDYAGTFATNKLTIDRNGNNIQGVANNSQIGTNRASVELVYIDSTRGWEYVLESNVADLQQVLFITATGGTITTSGNFKIHSFTGDGCFVVSQVGNSPVAPAGGPANVDYLVVAGGGGGARGNGSFSSGGGGAGGYRTTFPSPGCNAGSFPISATTYPITVGGGGAGNSSGGPNCSPSPLNGTSGSPSVFSTITSAGGGGGGGTNNIVNAAGVGNTGGSGGGSGGQNQVACSTGAAGNTPPVSPSQGNKGGNMIQFPSRGSAGGGGAGAAGTNNTGGNQGEPGGAGLANSITGSPVTRAGGGGGGGWGTTAGTGGPGGGGAGSVNGATATAGTANTGGGGGGGGACAPGGQGTGGAGGKGIVIIRYKFQ